MIRITSDKVSHSLNKYLRIQTVVAGLPHANTHIKPPGKSDQSNKLPQCQALTTISLGKRLPKFTLNSTVGFVPQKRYAHSDLKIPDFNHYRKGSTKDPKGKNSDTIDARRVIAGAVSLIGWAGLWYGSKSHVIHYVQFFGPSKEVLALAKIEVNLSDIPEGKSGMAKWRGKPLFIRHRTEDEIKKERAVNWKNLRDPERDEDRTKRPEWLIIIGICTHLGCIPVAYLGNYGGYYCPCHGSHFDASGRIRQGPAPTNLVVPEYSFIDDNNIIVG